MLKHCQFYMVQKVGYGGIQMEGIERAESTGLGQEAGGWEWLLGIQMCFEKKQNILSSKSNDLCTAATKQMWC